MRVRVEQAVREDAEVVAAFLAPFFPKLSQAQLRRLFNHPWASPEGTFGQKLIASGRVVGFLGYIFSERRINGVLRKQCNLACWAVEEQHRSDGYFLLFPVFKLLREGYAITDFTVSDFLQEPFARLGFSQLERSNWVIPALWGAGVWRRCEEALIDDPGMTDWLDDDSRRIFRDHQNLACRHLLLRGKTGPLYAVFTIEKRKRALPVAVFHHVSHRDRFRTGLAPILGLLFRRFHALFLVAGDHLFEPGIRLAGAFRSPPSGDKMFLSHTLRPEDVDELYSESVLF